MSACTADVTYWPDSNDPIQLFMYHFVELLASQNTWRQAFVDINSNIYRGYIYFEGSRGTDIQGNVITVLPDSNHSLAV